MVDRLCGLVVRVSDYRSGGPGFDSRALQEKQSSGVWDGGHSASWVQLRSYFKVIVAAPVWKAEDTAVGTRHADLVASSVRKKLALTSFTSSGRSVGIVHLRTEAMEFFFIVDGLVNVPSGYSAHKIRISLYYLCDNLFGN
jgi:hypothetical protein